MSQAVVLGALPAVLTLVLVTGSDFVAEVDMDTAWPEGTALSLVFENGQSWAATVSVTSARWEIDKATADQVDSGTRVRMVYVNGTDDQVLCVGRVARFD